MRRSYADGQIDLRVLKSSRRKLVLNNLLVRIINKSRELKLGLARHRQLRREVLRMRIESVELSSGG